MLSQISKQYEDLSFTQTCKKSAMPKVTFHPKVVSSKGKHKLKHVDMTHFTYSILRVNNDEITEQYLKDIVAKTKQSGSDKKVIKSVIKRLKKIKLKLYRKKKMAVGAILVDKDQRKMVRSRIRHAIRLLSAMQ